LLARGSLSRESFHTLIRRPLAARFLQSQGYRYVTISTHWAGTETSYIADRRYDFSAIFSGEFTNLLARTTMLRPLAPGVADLHLFTFDKLAEIPSIEGPTFAFVHFILPHSPYVFDREGNVRGNHSLVQFAKPRTRAPESVVQAEKHRIASEIAPKKAQDKARTRPWAEFEWPDRASENRPGRAQGYVDQLVYLNRRLIDIIDELDADSEVIPGNAWRYSMPTGSRPRFEGGSS
jgi:hypothetical protein